MAVETRVEPDVFKEATYVPSPRYKDGRAVMQHMMDEKYGRGGTMSPGDDNWTTTGCLPTEVRSTPTP